MKKEIIFHSTVLGRNLVRGTLPYKAHLIITWRCQAHCLMCDIWKREPINELTLEEWDRFFQRNNFLKWVTLSGGEPFLRNDIVEIAQSAAAHCRNLYCINTPTNGLAPAKIFSQVERILKIGIPEYALSISLDGPPDVHDRVRGVPGAFDKAMTVLQETRKLQKSYRSHFTVVVEHTLMPDAYGRFAEMVEAVRARVPDIASRDFLVAMPNVSEHYYGNAASAQTIKNQADVAETRKAVRHIIETRQQTCALTLRYMYPQLYLNKVFSYLDSRTPPMKCRATRSTIFVAADGSVYPCSSWDRKLGELRESDFSLKKILSQPGIADVRRDADAFHCGGCWTPCEAMVSLAEETLHPGTAMGLLKICGQTLFSGEKSPGSS